MFPDSIEALSFDCYGTLIDWETGIATALQPWLARTGLGLDREELLRRFGAVETTVQREQPTLLYPEVLTETMRRMATEVGAPATAEMTSNGPSHRGFSTPTAARAPDRNSSMSAGRKTSGNTPTLQKTIAPRMA